jgi:magnesium chelatase family protein
MPLAQVCGVVLAGVTGAIVHVEVDVAHGLPSVGVIGLPDASVSESRWRARSALGSVGATWPNQRVTISLSPAELRKNGAGLDLPIAVGVLLASDQLTGGDVRSTTFIGELGLDGRLHPTSGALAGALAARDAGLQRIVVPLESAAELARLPGIAVLVAGHLAQVLAILRGTDAGEHPSGPPLAGGPVIDPLDLADVRGHDYARFGLEVAAAGGHHLALTGPPGVGKTLLAERLPGLLPDLDDAAALEVAAIHSIAGFARTGDAFARPAYQAPHHSASVAALLGAVHGHRVMPGAVSLAHRGVLFMDEAPEFARPALEGLRQPLESGSLWLHRSGWVGRLPAGFQLVLAANPCPCGGRVGSGAECSCSTAMVRRYAARLSGPLMDRIDVRLGLVRPARGELASTRPVEGTAAVRDRVREARSRADARFAGQPWAVNARIPAAELRRRWLPDAAAGELLVDLERRSANLRGPDRVLRLAWSVADLAGHSRPTRDDVAKAIGLRGALQGWAA